jgi:hypothetical protein
VTNQPFLKLGPIRIDRQTHVAPRHRPNHNHPSAINPPYSVRPSGPSATSGRRPYAGSRIAAINESGRTATPEQVPLSDHARGQRSRIQHRTAAPIENDHAATHILNEHGMTEPVRMARDVGVANHQDAAGSTGQ